MENTYLQPLWNAFDEYADLPAIVDGDGTRVTTYADLKRRVLKVLAWMGSRGLAHHSFVPILLESGAEYVATEIGIWMAGHCAVPLGSSYPAERVAYIREHCEAPFAIDEQALAQIKASEPLDLRGAEPDYPDPDLPGILIYTSGSTGNPKGIVHTFAGLDQKHTSKVALTYSPKDRWAMGAPPYFIAFMTAYKVLKEGGQLHIIAPDTYHDIRRFEDYVADAGITHAFLSPTMLASFHNRAESLRLVFTGSERLIGQCGRDGYTLMNSYGMSETAGTISAYVVKTPYETTPVGIPQEEWRLVDEDGNDVQPGEEGELCLHGHFCEGYFKDPERTAELYRDGWLHTNDILRQLPDGNLVYVNRKDWMAKINGQRVEPSEVEEAISKLEGVERAVVKAFERSSGTQYLVAYFQGDAEADVLREQITQKLPSYMVPSHFVPVKKFAFLPNGKINRKVLQAPDPAQLASTFVAPETELEGTVCAAFASVFGLEEVSVTDDFILLGGDSVRVMALQAALPDLPLTTAMVYERRTPRRIAGALDEQAARHSSAREALDRAPLTQAQLGIYVESMGREGEAAYNNPLLFKVAPALDEQRLARAFEVAVAAHPALTAHVEEDEAGTPFLVLGAEAFEVVPEAMAEEDLERQKATLVAPFDLHAGPLVRVRLIRTPASLYLFFDAHHIAFDGTSLKVLMADVAAAYAGGEVAPEAYTALDLAQDEAQRRGTQALDAARSYYLDTFGGLDVESLPIADVRSDEVAFGTHEQVLDVDAAQFERFCVRVGVTANVAATTAFGRLLGAYSASSEALFATIYNGRTDRICARTVSMLVKTLPVYVSWDASTRVADLLSHTKAQLMASQSHDLFSFAEVSSELGIDSDVLFAYQGDYLALGTICDEPFERVPLATNATGSALDCQVFRADDRLMLRVEYRADKYSPEFVETFARAYGNVLQSMLSVEHVGEAGLVDDAMLEVLDGFHGKAVAYDEDATVVSLFRAAASEHAGRVAAVCADDELTFAELDRLSDMLAAHLMDKGARPHDVIAILVDRGLMMPVCALAALKCGCAYQPLDATYPDERLRFMVEDSNAAIVICAHEAAARLDAFAGTFVLLDDVRDVAALPSVPADLAWPEVSPDDLFILLYTSGTTGTPKGVRLLHSNLVCFCAWYRRYYGITCESRVGAYASFGFDAHMMDLYPALASGAACVIAPEEMRLDLMAMDAYFAAAKVTHVFMTTQVGRQFAIEAAAPTVAHLSMGGETLVPFEVPDRIVCHNGYGPTECTIFSTIHICRAEEASYPIGRLLDNMWGYVVDAHGNRLPVGAAGELWLAGPQVGDGYLNRPEKTAEVFGTDPFAPGERRRLYRTGDIVRWMPNGEVEFIGRRDGQVKVRGFRIELTEVEAVVRDFPAVRDATVCAFDHPAGGKYVAAYVVSDEKIDADALADFIRERKPPYMVPAAIVQIDRIPLNQNGKVFRRALPVPDLSAHASEEAPAQNDRPLNALEEALQSIVAATIGTDAFGVATPLTSCGLTSILTIRLLTLVYKRLGVRLQVTDLTDDVSVASLEDLILSRWMAGDGTPSYAPAAQAEEPFRAPLTFAQTGIYYDCLKDPDSLAYNIPARLDFDVALGAKALEQALRKVVAAHPALSTRFEGSGDEVALVPCQEPLAIGRISAADKDLDAVGASFLAPFDLADGPLARFALATTSERTSLFCDFHHLAFDGASMDVFLRDLTLALDGNAPEPERFTYADHAREEEAWKEGDAFEESRAYVAELMADYESATELTPSKAAQAGTGQAAECAVTLDFPAIEAACRQLSVTPAAWMLAACGYALSRYASERRVYLATISSGRSDVRCADTIGMFVNTLPLMLEVGDVSCEEFLQHAAASLGAATDHERYPFALVAQDTGFTPKVMYEYQLGIIDAPAIPHLEGVTSLEASEAKFPLTVRIELHDGSPAIVCRYNTALYDEDAVRGFATSMAIVARNLARDLAAPVRRVSLLDEARATELESFHREATGPVTLSLYHEGLSRQAGLRPDATALVAADATYTFAQLDEAANRMANALVSRGIKPRERIALLLPRTSRVIIAMFAVMKAGCAYIPCDPNYPEERVQHILKDSGAPLVITTKERVGDFAGAVDVEKLLLCDDTSEPVTDVTPDDLAYLIYTSGSTGKPKGVMLTHAGICNFHEDVPANILVRALTSKAHAFLTVTTLSFDMSIKEVGTPLVNGLTVVLADEEQTMDPTALARLMRKTGADAFNATHSRLKQYLEVPAFARAIAGCKVVLSGGERYTEGLLPKLHELTDATIINTYGPTETCVSSNMADLTHTDRITVGRPLYNVYECIVDADGNELPPGVVGELLIGGPGVARGYVNLPDKTSESFIEREGRRLYRSGDYARWCADGSVEILGRTDSQIKLRGLRIEIGEVEGALAQVPGVRTAIVQVDTIAGAEHLCAYYVASESLEPAEVHDELAKTLAAYMVPTAYLRLDEVPLTPNGKVDMRALPKAELLSVGSHVAPSGPVEKTFCDIFTSILGLPDVGATDSFFDIGGTSLMAIQITVEAAQAGYTVTYADVFANPTPRALAALVTGGEDNPDHDPEIDDFDYANISDVLAASNLKAFLDGKRRELGNILLTGAVGYLGVHILHEYLESTDGVAYCLLRSRGDVSAEQRLTHQLFYYFERNYADLMGSRIVCVEGDITKPIELPKDAHVDTVINCAAVVKHFSAGTEIEDVNVGGVSNLVAWCVDHDVTFVQVSTDSTVKCALRPQATFVGKTTEGDLFVEQELSNKYVRSKFLAERIVLEAVASEALSAKIMRVGNLSPRTADGEFQINYETNAAMGRLKSFALMGCAPYDQLDAEMEFSPIDEVARSILLLATTPEHCVVFHPFNHHKVLLGDVFLAMGKAGLDVRPVEREEFVSALHEAEADERKAQVLTSLLAYARRPGGTPAVVPQVANSFTMQVLYRLGFRWTPTSVDYLVTFLDALAGLGFFDEE